MSKHYKITNRMMEIYILLVCISWLIAIGIIAYNKYKQMHPYPQQTLKATE